MINKKRLIAIHLPQFHPFKENDEWWGKGFTEWRNVATAKPRFKGHYQPHIPADLGFYDLRLSETREQQAQMAKEHGIYGFCYYHYWFNGHQLMEKPLNDILKSKKPDFPFMLCWANENWTRAWDGSNKKILIKQDYSEKDDIEHINFLIDNYFSDPRYIKVEGKPVFCIYRTSLFPDIEKTIELWRKEAKKKNLELYICRIESFGEVGNAYMKNGIDAAVDFQPHIGGFKGMRSGLLCKIINKLSLFFLKKRISPLIMDYKEYVKYSCKNENFIKNYKQYPCVTPNWDNSPRRKGYFFAFKNSTPQLFGKWISFVYKNFKPYSNDENFIFINAWNEWAEGNHLEPDLKWGMEYLKAIKKNIK